jgi:ABC-type Fe3+-hydroxamate transport system substrate-binding protein
MSTRAKNIYPIRQKNNGAYKYYQGTMSTIKISEFPCINSPSDGDIFLINHQDTTSTVPLSAVAQKINRASNINSTTSRAYTLTVQNANSVVTITNALSCEVTVPAYESAALLLGTQIIIIQGAAGQITIKPATGVTVNSISGRLKTTGQYAMAALIKVDSDVWVLGGDIT